MTAASAEVGAAAPDSAVPMSHRQIMKAREIDMTDVDIGITPQSERWLAWRGRSSERTCRPHPPEATTGQIQATGFRYVGR